MVEMAKMEVLIALAAFIAFDVVAWFWAVDSRERGMQRSDRPVRAI